MLIKHEGICTTTIASSTLSRFLLSFGCVDHLLWIRYTGSTVAYVIGKLSKLRLRPNHAGHVMSTCQRLACNALPNISGGAV